MMDSANAKARTLHPGDFESPHETMLYRALVYARSNSTTALYFVAGVEGGPWNAINALTRSHKRHGGHCFYCRKAIKDGSGTIDHVEPLCRGGKSELQNLVLACKPCNATKGYAPIETFNPGAGKEWLEALLRQVQERLDRISPAS